jgi:anthraniloyl-CoA monooxygenase
VKIACVGGGPAALFFAILMKRLDPAHEVHVFERNRPDDTFGFGVVFSDATMAGLAEAEPVAFEAIAQHLVHWDDIDVQVGGETVSSTGHGFSGMSRRTLLEVLQAEAAVLGVALTFEHEVRGVDEVADFDLVLAADGVNSVMRQALAAEVGPRVDVRSNRFVWLGTSKTFPAFTFYFKHDPHGLWRVHAYQYEPGRSTFIVECRDETWRRAGLDRASEHETVAFLERLFANELDGHPLIANRSVWRQFPTVRCERWSAGPIVLVGDAAHTAHFSVGSGTRLAMEDALALRNALIEVGLDRTSSSGDVAPRVRQALAIYETTRRPQVESLQRAAQASLQWFEDVERYGELPPLQFTFALLTRSLRITHEDMRQRDPAFLARVDAWFAARAVAAAQAVPSASAPPSTLTAPAQSASPRSSPTPSSLAVPPPMFTPFRLRDVVLPNRVVVSPMCQYKAVDGCVGDWHLVHIGSRAIGGAGLVMAEMTDVSAEARISPGCAGLYTGAHAAAWKRIVDFVHAESVAKIGVQLGHAGRKAATRRLWEGDSEPLPSDAQWPIVSASPLAYFPDRSQIPREMTRADMIAAVADYVRATELAIEAGFDLLEVHMAHGYLLASFVSPLTNRRDDEYGGSLDNRLRFPLEVFAACRAVWPAHLPMSVRISATDWMPDGLSGNESVAIAHRLAAHGCDIVDVSAGQTVPDQRPEYGRLFQTPFADRIRHEAGIATMAVGNISSYMDVNTILASGRADLCLLARAHLFDPFWTRHAAYTLGWPLPWPDPYRSVERYTPRFEFRFN